MRIVWNVSNEQISFPMVLPTAAKQQQRTLELIRRSRSVVVLTIHVMRLHLAAKTKLWGGRCKLGKLSNPRQSFPHSWFILGMVTCRENSVLDKNSISETHSVMTSIGHCPNHSFPWMVCVVRWTSRFFCPAEFEKARLVIRLDCAVSAIPAFYFKSLGNLDLFSKVWNTEDIEKVRKFPL